MQVVLWLKNAWTTLSVYGPTVWTVVKPSAKVINDFLSWVLRNEMASRASHGGGIPGVSSSTCLPGLDVDDEGEEWERDEYLHDNFQARGGFDGSFPREAEWEQYPFHEPSNSSDSTLEEKSSSSSSSSSSSQSKKPGNKRRKSKPPRKRSLSVDDVFTALRRDPDYKRPEIIVIRNVGLGESLGDDSNSSGSGGDSEEY